MGIDKKQQIAPFDICSVMNKPQHSIPTNLFHPEYSSFKRGYCTPNQKLACFVPCYTAYYFDQNIILTVLIHNIWMSFLSSLDKLLKDACIIFQKGVENFEIAHKTC